MDEDWEEFLIGVELATNRLKDALRKAFEAVKAEDWRVAEAAVDELEASLTGYGYPAPVGERPAPREQDYGYPDPAQRAELKNVIGDLKQSILKKLKDVALKALVRLRDLLVGKSVSAAEEVVDSSAGDALRVTLTAGALVPTTGRKYRAVAMRPGIWKGHNLRCSEAVLQRDAGKFTALASFLNPTAREPGAHGYPPIERLVGIFRGQGWDAQRQAIVGEYELLNTPAAEWFGRFADRMVVARQAGMAVPDVGLSAVAWLRAGGVDGEGVRDVQEILSVDRLDVVYGPAAGGALEQILAAVGPFGGDGMGDDVQGESLIASPVVVNPGIVNPVGVDVEAATELLRAQRSAVLDARLSAAGLPEELASLVRESLPGEWRVADLDTTLQRVQASWAKLEERRVVQGVYPQVTGMQDSLDRAGEALLALLEGRSPAGGVRPLSGIREAYTLFSGDYEMRGMFYPEQVALANVTSSTMAGLVANALNKIVINQFQQYPKWWEDLVYQEDFSNLQAVRWITLGGVGELPTVGEGAAYTELTWDDQTETSTWLKKGGYLGITLETIDKDDVAKVRTAPRALAQAAWLTLSKSISGIFTSSSGLGPTMSDSVALFNAASHSNLGSSALSASSWAATRVAMRKQTELNSGERLGGLVVPKFLLVPPDLENTALIVLASEGSPGSANKDTNPAAEGNTHDARIAAAWRRLVVVDLWANTANWAVLADPKLYPSIGLGFRYGRTPEIFSVASPNSGLMFSNDVMPVKVRFFYAAGPTDWRGLYKHNV